MPNGRRRAWHPSSHASLFLLASARAAARPRPRSLSLPQSIRTVAASRPLPPLDGRAASRLWVGFRLSTTLVTRFLATMAGAECVWGEREMNRRKKKKKKSESEVGAWAATAQLKLHLQHHHHTDLASPSQHTPPSPPPWRLSPVWSTWVSVRQEVTEAEGMGAAKAS